MEYHYHTVVVGGQSYHEALSCVNGLDCPETIFGVDAFRREVNASYSSSVPIRLNSSPRIIFLSDARLLLHASELQSYDILTTCGAMQLHVMSIFKL